MRIPVWLTFGVAILVIGFGIYRLRISFRPPPEDTPRRGLHAMSPGKHRFVGVLYLALGIALLAVSLGWNPMGNLFAPATDTAKGAEPTKAQLPEDGLKK